MLLSLALILLIGLVLGEVFQKLHLPSFIGMIITGIVLGPYALGLIDSAILEISPDLREIALVVILLRAGLNLDISDLKKIGKPAILMSFIPAIFEIVIVVLLAPVFFDISLLEAAILGSVLAAVSPAVIVPKMIKLITEKYGHEKRVPHLIMASASVDDIFVIVLFSSFMQMYVSGTSMGEIITLPIAIVVGVLVGVVVGYLLSKFFAWFRVRDTIKVLMILAVAFLMIELESLIGDTIPFSSLLAIMVLGISFLRQSEERALRLRDKFSKVWVFAELVLFVLVGAAVDIEVALGAGLIAIGMLTIQLGARFMGVQLCLTQSNLNQKEKLFCGVAYIPKATVQAAIAAIPLTMGVPAGELILAIGVLSIIVTAPLGALGIDLLYKKTLEKEI